jgi:hypothetical protein
MLAQIAGLISVVALLFVWVKFHELAKEHSKWLRFYTAIGILSYFVPLIAANNFLHVKYQADELLSLAVGFILGSLISAMLFFNLKKSWEAAKSNNPDVLDDDVTL